MGFFLKNNNFLKNVEKLVVFAKILGLRGIERNIPYETFLVSCKYCNGMMVNTDGYALLITL